MPTGMPGLCALFTLASSSSRTSKNCCCGEQASSHVVEQEKPAKMEEAERKARTDPEADLRIVFSTFDHDGDNFIIAGKLEESLKRLGMAVSAVEAAAMVARVDANIDGLINIPKKRKQLLPPSVIGDGAEEEGDDEQEMDMKEAFDGNKVELISAEELGTVLGSLGLRGCHAAAECRDMIRLV